MARYTVRHYHRKALESCLVADSGAVGEGSRTLARGFRREGSCRSPVWRDGELPRIPAECAARVTSLFLNSESRLLLVQ